MGGQLCYQSFDHVCQIKWDTSSASLGFYTEALYTKGLSSFQEPRVEIYFWRSLLQSAQNKSLSVGDHFRIRKTVDKKDPRVISIEPDTEEPPPKPNHKVVEGHNYTVVCILQLSTTQYDYTWCANLVVSISYRVIRYDILSLVVNYKRDGEIGKPIQEYYLLYNQNLASGKYNFPNKETFNAMCLTFMKENEFVNLLTTGVCQRVLEKEKEKFKYQTPVNVSQSRRQPY